MSIGAAVLGAYLGGKAGKKIGTKLTAISDHMKRAGLKKGTVDYQQSTTWPQEKQDNPFAIGTSQAKKMGYEDFSEGSEGDEKRDEIVEAIKENSEISKLLKAVEGLKEGLIDGGQAGEPYSDSSENIKKPSGDLIPEKYEPPEDFMVKEDCGCENS